MRIIAGPCQHESLVHSLMIAKHCKYICDQYKVEYIFKASFDKANRSSAGSKRGIGFTKTLLDFLKLKTQIPGLQILTDFHTVEQLKEARKYAGVIDVCQIPAFLCRQTDLVVQAAKMVHLEEFKYINIKKGQFLAPWDVKGILSKVNLPHDKVWITERGTSFGYNTLVVDFTGICYLLDNYDTPIVFDATHSVQRPGGNGATSGGNRIYAHRLAKAAKAVGVDNFFFEVHDDPDNAPSDGPNSLYLKDFEVVVSSLVNN
jgi:2-dehydro-3-deoxyphosphooctonate aldolase (KDO 8-P synthase)|tara:strand:+ start:234 stop:1013 length:780 start_codon:yes stop_codon:yes gene_type:complete